MVADNNSKYLSGSGEGCLNLDFTVKIRGSPLSRVTLALSQHKSDVHKRLPATVVLACVEVPAEVVACSWLPC